MDIETSAVSATVDDAAWRIVACWLAAEELPPGDPERGRLLDEAARLRRRIEALAVLDQPHICPPSTMTV